MARGMVERVAIELRKNLPNEMHLGRGEAIRIAHAIIAIMREPTGEIMEAKAVDDGGGKANVDGYLDYLSADNIWRAMIDAALDDARTA